VYEELRRLARRQARRDWKNQTLDTTALVHEAYLKLVGHNRVTPTDRAHFFATAARAMRQIVVDHARRKAAARRGGGVAHTTMNESDAPEAQSATEVLAVHEALEQLEKLDERLGRLVEMRYFAGLSEEETARLLEISESTVKRDWRKARGFLYRALR
jgi:RNA polymerase sigma factor (TIGR02999 family)